MENVDYSPLSLSLELGKNIKPLNDSTRSLDISRTSKMRPRIIYRTPTHSICITDIEEFGKTSDQNRVTSLGCPPLTDNNAANCGDHDMGEQGLDMSGQLLQESTDLSCLQNRDDTEDVKTTNNEDMNNQDQGHDSDKSSNNDSEESIDLEIPGQKSNVDKRYLALYCNNYSNEFTKDSSYSKDKRKPKNNSESLLMDNCPGCCPAGKPSSPCNKINKSNPKPPHFSVKLTVNRDPLSPAVNRELGQLKPFPSRISTLVGVLWTLLSIMVAGTCSFSFLQPFWFTQPQTGNSIGMYSYCIHDTRRIHDMIQTCGINGGQFMFSNVRSHAWQAACVLYGGGCTLLCFSALLAVCSMCTTYAWNKRIVICSGYIQLMAVLVMVGGLLVFPLGLDTRFFQHYCGQSAGPYNSGDCQLGWGYMLGIIGTALSIFCPFLSQYTDVKIHG